jgi:hypothetical protein
MTKTSTAAAHTITEDDTVRVDGIAGLGIVLHTYRGTVTVQYMTGHTRRGGLRTHYADYSAGRVHLVRKGNADDDYATALLAEHDATRGNVAATIDALLAAIPAQS